MLMNLAIGLPTMLVCLILQVAVTFWSVRYYVRQSRRTHLVVDCSKESVYVNDRIGCLPCWCA